MSDLFSYQSTNLNKTHHFPQFFLTLFTNNNKKKENYYYKQKKRKNSNWISKRNIKKILSLLTIGNEINEASFMTFPWFFIWLNDNWINFFIFPNQDITNEKSHSTWHIIIVYKFLFFFIFLIKLLDSNSNFLKRFWIEAENLKTNFYHIFLLAGKKIYWKIFKLNNNISMEINKFSLIQFFYFIFYLFPFYSKNFNSMEKMVNGNLN